MTNGKLYTYQELAALLQVHHRTAARMVRGRRLFRLGHTVRVPAAVVSQLLEEHTRPSPVQARTPRKRTRRPSVQVSNDTRTAPKAA